MKSKLVRAALVASFLPLLVANTCKREIDAGLFNPFVDGEDSNTPAGIINAHMRAWNARDLGAYSALLDDDFKFYPLSSEVADIPWLEGDSWDRETELGIIAHMFDPIWNGGAAAVSNVGLDAIPFSTVNEPDGDAQVWCTFSGFIQTGPTEGYQVGTWLYFELDLRGGILRIDSIRELPPDGVPAGVRANSLGSVKVVYR